MHIYIARHGETNYNVLDICTSDPAADAYLTDVGIEQSRKLAEKLKDAPIEHIFVSRLKRTQQTAEYINKGRGIPISIDARLDDNRSGFDGRPTRDHTAFLQASKDPWNARFNSGESWDDVHKRVTEFLAELGKKPHKTVLGLLLVWWHNLLSSLGRSWLMLVTQSGSPLLIAGQKILQPGRFVDNFQRGTTFNSSPVGMGWTDMGILQPQNFDKSHIYDGMVGSADPYWRGKNGATMAPDDQWEHYADYPGQAVGGLGAMIRNVGDGIYNYDVTTRVCGELSGGTAFGPESEGTPLVGVNVASDGLGYGAWLVNLRISFGFDVFIFLIGTMGNPGENFFITHTSGAVAHTQGQERDVTLKYRGTSFTVWLDGVQVTNIVNHPSGTAHGAAPIPVTAPYQNQSWAGFEYDQHITPPSLTTTTPSIINYTHQAIT